MELQQEILERGGGGQILRFLSPGRRCLCLTDSFDRMLVPRGVRCGPPFQSPEEGGRRLGGHREEKQFVGRADEEFYSVWRGSEAKEERGFGRGASGITSP